MKNFKFNFSGTAAAKIAAMKAAGIHVTNSPAEMGKTILRAIINK
jgi:succinyl-CoA synthetase alpha subunit